MSIKKAVIASISMVPNRPWYAVGVTEGDYVPVILPFDNQRQRSGDKFGEKKDNSQVKIGTWAVLEDENKFNPNNQLIATTWAPADEKTPAKVAKQPASPQKKAIAETKLAKSIPHASKYKVEKPKPAAAKAVKPLKLTVSDDRMVRLKLTEWNPGDHNQLYCGRLTGGQTDGLRGWLQRNGMPTRDFTFEVEKSSKTWVPADKAVIKLLADALEPAGV